MDEMTQQTSKPTNQPTNHRTKRRVKPWLIIGGGLLLVLLVGAAFVGGRLLARQPAQQERPAQQGLILESRDQGGVVHQEAGPPPERPEELPDEEPDVVGVFTRRDGNSLFVGTGRLTAKASVDGTIETEYDGPELEIVVTHDTEIYEERIEIRSEEGTPEDIVQPGSLEDIVGNMMVRVWGEKRGDRITARVLVYQSIGGPGGRP
jgi:hypothetical protein